MVRLNNPKQINHSFFLSLALFLLAKAEEMRFAVSSSLLRKTDGRKDR